MLPLLVVDVGVVLAVGVDAERGGVVVGLFNAAFPSGLTVVDSCDVLKTATAVSGDFFSTEE